MSNLIRGLIDTGASSGLKLLSQDYVTSNSELPAANKRKNYQFVAGANFSDPVTGMDFTLGHTYLWLNTPQKWIDYGIQTSPSGDAPGDASYLLLSANGQLPNSRQFIDGNITKINSTVAGKFSIDVDQALIEITSSQVSDFTASALSATASAYLPSAGIDASKIVSGSLPIARGGTGQSSFAAGVLKSDGTNLSSSSIVNADISDTANISASKISSIGTGFRVPVTDSDGKVTATSNVTAVEIDYVHNVTSPIQTQINNLTASLGNYLTIANNLSDVASKPTSRSNLSVPAQQQSPGNPNGNLAGALGDFAVDVGGGGILYYCTAAGTTSTAVWARVNDNSEYLPLSGGTLTGNLLFANNLNIGTSTSSSTLNIGTDTNTTVINIGNTNTVVNIYGERFKELVTDLDIKDKLMTLNYGGAAGSATGVGFEIEENSVITAYFKTNSTRTGFSMLAPARTGVFDFQPSSQAFTYFYLTGTLTANRSITLPDADSNPIQPLTAATTNQWVQYISNDGVQHLVQPAFSNLSGSASLTTQVSGVLPIANGGTNSSAALTGSKLMVSSSTAITESSNFSVNADGGLVISTATNTNNQMGLTLTQNGSGGNYAKAVQLLQPNLPTSGAVGANAGVNQIVWGQATSAQNSCEFWFSYRASGGASNTGIITLNGSLNGFLFSQYTTRLGRVDVTGVLGRSGLDSRNTSMYITEITSSGTGTAQTQYTSLSSSVGIGIVAELNGASYNASVTNGDHRPSYIEFETTAINSGAITGAMSFYAQNNGTQSKIFTIDPTAGLTVISGSGSGIALKADASSALQATTLQQVQALVGTLTKLTLTDTPITSSGTTITLTGSAFLRVSGTQAVANLDMPGSPSDGQVCVLASTGSITATNWGGSFVNSAPPTTFFATGNYIGFSYQSVVGAWLRVF